MAGKKSTNVQAALALVAGGMSAYAAAKEAGAKEQSVYAAVRRAKAKPAVPSPGCRCCLSVPGMIDPGAELRHMIEQGGALAQRARGEIERLQALLAAPAPAPASAEPAFSFERDMGGEPADIP